MLEEEQAGPSQTGLVNGFHQASQPASASSVEHRERQKKLAEAQRKAKEERKKIVDQVSRVNVG